MLFWWRSFPGRAHRAIMQLFNVKALPFAPQYFKKDKKREEHISSNGSGKAKG